MNTTPLPEEETKPTRGRGRGRPTTESAATVSEADNISDETQVGISFNYNVFTIADYIGLMQQKVTCVKNFAKSSFKHWLYSAFISFISIQI